MSRYVLLFTSNITLYRNHWYEKYFTGYKVLLLGMKSIIFKENFITYSQILCEYKYYMPQNLRFFFGGFSGAGVFFFKLLL